MYVCVFASIKRNNKEKRKNLFTRKFEKVFILCTNFSIFKVMFRIIYFDWSFYVFFIRFYCFPLV